MICSPSAYSFHPTLSWNTRSNLLPGDGKRVGVEAAVCVEALRQIKQLRSGRAPEGLLPFPFPVGGHSSAVRFNTRHHLLDLSRMVGAFNKSLMPAFHEP